MSQRKQNIIAYTLIFAFQLLMLPTFEFLRGGWMMLLLLLLFLGTAACLSFATHAQTHKINELSVFFHSMLSHGIRVFAIMAADALMYCFIRKYVDFAVFWLVFALLTLLLASAVVLAVGAARTMLFKDR